MRLRTRFFLLGILILVLPLAVVVVAVRSEGRERLQRLFEDRSRVRLEQIAGAIDSAGEDLNQRLGAIRDEILEDLIFRRAVIDGDPTRTRYRRDYAKRLGHLAGMEMLIILDEEGRIISSCHDPASMDGFDPLLLRMPIGEGTRPLLLRASGPRFDVVVLAKRISLAMDGRIFSVIGGERLDRSIGVADVEFCLLVPYRLRSGDRWMDQTVRFGTAETPVDSVFDPRSFAVDSIELLYLVEADERALVGSTRLLVASSLAPLADLQEQLDLSLAVFVVLVLVGMLLLVYWISGWITMPLRDLTEKTRWVNLERPGAVDFAVARGDEIGELSRFVGAMTDRLRRGATKLVDSERRAAYGDLARKVKHELVHGFRPIRSVVSHLTEVANEEPDQLVEVYRQRAKSLEGGLVYLEELSQRITRLTGEPDLQSIDLNRLLRELEELWKLDSADRVQLHLAENLAHVRVDPIEVRRILENLVTNAIESYEGGVGPILLATEGVDRGGDPWVVMSVRDRGVGMKPEQIERAFEMGESTKGTERGFGLTNVEELVRRNFGTVEIESESGVGTTVRVAFPADRESSSAGGGE